MQLQSLYFFMMDQDKRLFVEVELASLLMTLADNTAAKWGKMNAQQMLEHLQGFFEVSTEKKIYPLVTPEEQLPLFKEFLYSDKKFRENTKAPVAIIGEEPLPLTQASLQDAQLALQQTISDFFTYFTTHPGKQTIHPVFGPLNFEEWVLLHYKHATHHCRQFALIT